MYAIGFVLMLAYGAAQFVAAYAGIDFHFGAVWAVLAIIAGLFFRFSLPITVGAFFGAMDVWGWNWMLAGLFAAPGLVFLIPGVISTVIGAFGKR